MVWHSLVRGEQGTSAAHRVHGDMTNQRRTVHVACPGSLRDVPFGRVNLLLRLIISPALHSSLLSPLPR